MTDKEMIEAHVEAHGLKIASWVTTEDGEEAEIGRFEVNSEDYEDEGLYVGDVGVVRACVVGAERFNNRRAIFTFTADGLDGGEEIEDLSALDAA